MNNALRRVEGWRKVEDQELSREKSFLNDCFLLLSHAIPTTLLKETPLFSELEPIGRQDLKQEKGAVEKLYSLHASFVSGEESNKHGVVFTPKHAAIHLVEKLQLKEEHNEPLQVLDPACGGGVLLCEAFLHLLEHQKESTYRGAVEILTKSIYGIDRDPTSVWISRFALTLALAQHFTEEVHQTLSSPPIWWRNIICGNPLLTPLEDRKRSLGAVDLRAAFHLERSFSHIIGNPPYGLSRDQQIEKRELTIYKERYKSLTFGKPNKYLLFLARSLELLGDGGRLSFLIPNSWLGIVSGKMIREYLLRNGFIREIEVSESRLFQSRGVETVYVTLEKRFKNSFSLLVEGKSEKSTITLVSNELLQDSKEALIPLFPSVKAYEVWKKIEKNSIPLSKSNLKLIPRIALQVYATGKGRPPQTRKQVKEHTFHSENKIDDTSYRYLIGKDISPFQVQWSGQYLRYGEWVAEHQPLSFYSGPRIVLREILGKAPRLFQAAFIDTPALYNRSILHIIPTGDEQQNREIQCRALVGILNSSLGSFYLQVKGRKASRKLFPKIVNGDLLDFPIAERFEEYQEELAKLVRQLEKNPSSTELLELLDELVEELYGVKVEDRRFTTDR